MHPVKYSAIRGMLVAPDRMCLPEKYSAIRGMLVAPIRQILFFYGRRIWNAVGTGSLLIHTRKGV